MLMHSMINATLTVLFHNIVNVLPIGECNVKCGTSPSASVDQLTQKQNRSRHDYHVNGEVVFFCRNLGFMALYTLKEDSNSLAICTSKNLNMLSIALAAVQQVGREEIW